MQVSVYSTMESDRTIASLPPPAPPSDGSSRSLQRVQSLNGRTSGPARRSTRGQWTAEEDEILRNAVQHYKGKNWKKIAECFKDRTDVQCLHRWQKVLNPELIKGPWSKEEDETIVQMVMKYGPKKWSAIAQHLPGRIGKQCRERWHNHLNPTINKEAWTQEEELILIHAHQIYGNKWAELSKFLHGRTDNAIKNHWNSSVKKKLDSYRASGLLAQFQGFPAVSHQNQTIPAPSLRIQHSSRDDSFCRDGTEVEGNSDCSQGSAIVSCSQTASDMSNVVGHVKEEALESFHDKEQNASPAASCTDQYLTSFEDVNFTVPELPCEFSCSSGYLDENLFQEPVISTTDDCASGAQNLPNISSELLPESSSFSEGNAGANEKHEMVSGHMQAYAGTNVSMAMGSDIPGCKLVTDNGICGATLLKESSDICLSSDNVDKYSEMIDYDTYISDALNIQSSGFLLSGEGGCVASEAHHAPRSDAVGNSTLPSNPPLLSGYNISILSKKEQKQSSDCLVGSQGEGLTGKAEDSIIYLDSSDPSWHDHIDVTGVAEQADLVKDSSNLVPVNTFSAMPSDVQLCPSDNGKLMTPLENQEAGAICYEPPRFPRLDIPFFSCDLVQSGMDVQQEYSPLGIRQLMMSSMNSSTPFKLWDSPPSGGSPEALLKSAARTFSCTPSILKKRHRDLLSPLSPFSERRFDKKIGNDFNQGVLCPSNLSKEFSRLDVMFDEAAAHSNSLSTSSNSPGESVEEDKENIYPTHGDREDGGRSVAVLENHALGKEELNDDVKTVLKNDASETPRGVLVELNMTMESSSPDELNERTSELGKWTTRDHSPLGDKKQADDALPALAPSIPSTSLAVVENLVNEVRIDNLSIFGDTPFRRSIESPSAWKSPWFFNSFVSSPRFDTDITIEDMGIFMSPGEISFDAIGLMKQINERSADAYAGARKVLGKETPESILKGKWLKSEHPDEESSGAHDSQHDGRLRLASNVLTERRILDFSEFECGTPRKSKDKGESLSSPSSSLCNHSAYIVRSLCRQNTEKDHSRCRCQQFIQNICMAFYFTQTPVYKWSIIDWYFHLLFHKHTCQRIYRKGKRNIFCI